MAKRLAIESFLVTLFLFLLMGILRWVPINLNALKPLEHAIAGFDMIDLYYSQLNPTEGEFSKNVVLVNIGNANREEIGQLIEYVSFGNPAAIGVDVFFSDPKEAYQDSVLEWSISSHPNVILGAAFNEEERVLKKSYSGLHPQGVGFTNFVGSDPRYSTIRYYKPVVENGADSVLAFSVKLAQLYAPESVQGVLQKSEVSQAIRYTGNYQSFIHFEKDELLNAEVNPDVFADKVIIIGFMGNYIGDEYNYEDRFFTPLNPKVSGRTVPDMNGMVIHANIVEMIVSGNAIYRTGNWFKVLFTVLITYFHVFFYMFLMVKLSYYFDALALVLQIISSLFITLLVFGAYHYFNFRLYVNGGLVGIAFSVEILFIYEAVVNSIHKKFGVKSILIEEE